MDKPIADLRTEYALTELDEAHADPDPLRQFDAWFDAAVRSCGLEPNAMSLATVDAAGRPAVRIVLLKGYDGRGLVFYTNYDSRKGRELANNPRAAACFWWPELERQVRIEGRVERISPAESDAYFATRPRASQLAAAASPQSDVVPSRAPIERKLAELERQYEHQSVPRPANWGGYRLIPDVFEFWQGRQKRLHDRLHYASGSDGTWVRTRLAP
jgi:pyridoxamine 5'-phosphate oxidase